MKNASSNKRSQFLFRNKHLIHQRYTLIQRRASITFQKIRDRSFAGETITDLSDYGDNNQKRNFYEVTYSPLPDKDGEIIGIINKSSDVTLAQEKQASLKQAHDELEARVIQRTVELQQANE